MLLILKLRGSFNIGILYIGRKELKRTASSKLWKGAVMKVSGSKTEYLCMKEREDCGIVQVLGISSPK